MFSYQQVKALEWEGICLFFTTPIYDCEKNKSCQVNQQLTLSGVGLLVGMEGEKNKTDSLKKQKR